MLATDVFITRMMKNQSLKAQISALQSAQSKSSSTPSASWSKIPNSPVKAVA